MSNPKCVSAEFVFSDGRVFHVGEEGAEKAAIHGLNISDHLVKSSYPLRKVTEVRGHAAGWTDEPVHICWPEEDGLVHGCHLNGMFPDGVVANSPNYEDAPFCDFRIVVEVVPVKE